MARGAGPALRWGLVLAGALIAAVMFLDMSLISGTTVHSPGGSTVAIASERQASSSAGTEPAAHDPAPTPKPDADAVVALDKPAPPRKGEQNNKGKENVEDVSSDTVPNAVTSSSSAASSYSDSDGLASSSATKKAAAGNHHDSDDGTGFYNGEEDDDTGGDVVQVSGSLSTDTPPPKGKEKEPWTLDFNNRVGELPTTQTRKLVSKHVHEEKARYAWLPTWLLDRSVSAPKWTAQQVPKRVVPSPVPMKDADPLGPKYFPDSHAELYGFEEAMGDEAHLVREAWSDAQVEWFLPLTRKAWDKQRYFFPMLHSLTFDTEKRTIYLHANCKDPQDMSCMRNVYPHKWINTLDRCRPPMDRCPGGTPDQRWDYELEDNMVITNSPYDESRCRHVEPYVLTTWSLENLGHLLSDSMMPAYELIRGLEGRKADPDAVPSYDVPIIWKFVRGRVWSNEKVPPAFVPLAYGSLTSHNWNMTQLFGPPKRKMPKTGSKSPIHTTATPLEAFTEATRKDSPYLCWRTLFKVPNHKTRQFVTVSQSRLLHNGVLSQLGLPINPKPKRPKILLVNRKPNARARFLEGANDVLQLARRIISDAYGEEVDARVVNDWMEWQSFKAMGEELGETTLVITAFGSGTYNFLIAPRGMCVIEILAARKWLGRMSKKPDNELFSKKNPKHALPGIWRVHQQFSLANDIHVKYLHSTTSTYPWVNQDGRLKVRLDHVEHQVKECLKVGLHKDILDAKRNT